MVNIGSTASGGKVLAVKQDLAKILLTQPVCTQEGEKIALSRRVDKVGCAHSQHRWSRPEPRKFLRILGGISLAGERSVARPGWSTAAPAGSGITFLARQVVPQTEEHCCRR